MAARHAVVETCELLENIIIELPPADIQRVKRVSKHWQQLIERSRSLRLAGCVEPIRAPDLLETLYRGTELMIPHYPQGTNLSLHPSKYSSMYQRRYSINHVISSAFFPVRSLDRIDEHASAFATMPPCQAIALILPRSRAIESLPQARPPVWATVYVKEGVRVRQLTDAVSAMWSDLEGNNRLLEDDNVTLSANVLENKQEERSELLEDGSVDPGQDSGVCDC